MFHLSKLKLFSIFSLSDIILLLSYISEFTIIRHKIRNARKNTIYIERVANLALLISQIRYII